MSVETNNKFTALSDDFQTVTTKKTKKQTKKPKEPEKKPDENIVKLPQGIINFGKYKGKSIIDIINEDQKYCRWLMVNLQAETNHKKYVLSILQKNASLFSEPEN